MNPGYAFIWTSFNIWCLQIGDTHEIYDKSVKNPGNVFLKKLKLDLSSQSNIIQAYKSSN